jgi:Na+-translocating ferredoxin:NAD+ oxidoreductase RnfD subunit
MSSEMRPHTTVATSAPAAPRRGFLSIDNRYLPPLLITCILIGAHFSFGILEAYRQTAAAIVTAMATELVLGRATYGKWPHPASAYISGISVGILVRSPFIWPFFFASFISILSKYVLRLNGRHLWNPSNLGVSAVLFLAPHTVTLLSIQWGNNVWPMVIIWLLGFAIVWRVGRLHVSATYVASFVVLAFVRSAITGVPWQAVLAPITGPMYQLFIFFMVTDPKVSVRSKRGQALVVVAVAIVEALLRLREVIYAPFYALFLVGPAALAIEAMVAKRRPSA